MRVVRFTQEKIINNKFNLIKMNSIIQEKQRVFLARPLRQKSSKESDDSNIFASLRSTQPLPALTKMRGKSYDFVGNQQFKSKYIQAQPLNPTKKQQSMLQQSNINNNTMNTTINRNTIMSKLTREQTNIITKQMKYLDRYRQYQDIWDNQSRKLHKMTLRNKNTKTLLEDNVKDIYIHPNDDRMDIINHYVVNMWEMSLRNNNKILQRHIKGNKFKQVELEEMLQTDRGIKSVQRSIPVLPIQKLKNLKKKQLCLTGRNRAYSDTMRSGMSTERASLGQTQNQQQVYKISYTGNVKWMSTEGL